MALALTAITDKAKADKFWDDFNSRAPAG